MKALVTGATGMLGSHLADRLLAAGVEVRSLVRPSSNARYLETLPIEVVRGELTDPKALRLAMAGIRWVFHAAGYVTLSCSFSRDIEFDRFKSVNVDGTKALLSASHAAGVSRFVFASSTSVYSLDAPVPISETAPLDPFSDYGRSKVIAEAHVQDYQARGLPTTIVRPCIIYGPRDRYFTPAARSLARLPLVPLIDGGRYLHDLVYVGDVADLMWQSSQSEAAIGRVYNAASGAPLSVRHYVESFREPTGWAPWIMPVTHDTMQRLARLIRWYMKRVAPGIEDVLTPTGLAYLSRDVYYDMSRAKQDLNFSPRFSFKRGLAATWAAHQGARLARSLA